jgi:sugar O-acyltransferase (sialic acid O-acetyltransferase NeuD family)
MRSGRVFVVGAGGHGKVVIDALFSVGGFEIVGLLDDDKQQIGREILGIPVVGSTIELRSLAEKYRVDGAALGIGNNYIREQKFRQVKAAGLAVVSVIHASSYISRFTVLGEGVVALAGSVIGPGSVLGDNVCVNTCASVDHDNHVGYSCQIFPNAALAGGVYVGEFSYIGMGAVVVPNRKVGRFAYVAAGAVVIKDVADGLKVAGVPAHEIGVQSERAADSSHE